MHRAGQCRHIAPPRPLRPHMARLSLCAAILAMLMAIPGLGCTLLSGTAPRPTAARLSVATKTAGPVVNPPTVTPEASATAEPELFTDVTAWPGPPGELPVITLPPRQTDQRKIDQAEALFRRGKAAYDGEKWEEAISAFDQVLELNPWHAQAYNLRGAAYGRVGPFNYLDIFLEHERQQIVDYTHAIAADPTWSHPYANRAAAFFSRASVEPVREDRHEWLELALVDYRRVVELEGTRVQANCGCAVILAQLGDCDGAYKEALSCPLEHTANYVALSTGLRCHGDLDPALRTMDQLLDRQPEAAELYWERARINMERGKFEQALSDYRTAAEKWGGDFAPGNLLYGQAAAEYHLGNYDRVKEYIEQGRRQTWIDWGEPYYYLGMVYLKEGDTEAALNALQWAEQTLDEGPLLDATRAELGKLSS